MEATEGERRMKKRWMAAAGLLVSMGLVAGCGGSSDKTELSLVAYSTPQEAYKQIIGDFQKTDAGKDVEFSESYGGSGDQSRAVEGGLAADVVEFSLEPDMTRLVEADMVDEDWNTGPEKGMITDSVVVWVVREGNPLGIDSWDDLTQDGVEVITPNPFTSGGARWNVMAAYGAQLEQGKTEEEATQYLADLFDNVVVQDDSARKSLQTFTGGKGDVLLAYENEAIFAQQQGEDLEYIVPDETILIENPVAITSTSEHPEEAQAFLDYLRTEEAQEAFVKNGYRPTRDGVPGAEDFPTPSALFDITEFGGWSDVSSTFFDPDGSVMADIEQGIGVSLG